MSDDVFLKPCPMCGAVPELVILLPTAPISHTNRNIGSGDSMASEVPNAVLAELPVKYKVACNAKNKDKQTLSGCGLSTPVFDSIDKACICWNRRTENFRRIPFVRGPWKYSKDMDGNYIVGATDDQFNLKSIICYLHPVEMHVTDEVAESTARLITALPAVVNRLQKTVQLLQEMDIADKSLLKKTPAYKVIIQKRRELQKEIKQLLSGIAGVEFLNTQDTRDIPVSMQSQFDKRRQVVR